VAVRAAAGSVFLRTGARFGRVGAREGARFGDAPARSALRGSGPGGGDASATLGITIGTAKADRRTTGTGVGSATGPIWGVQE
jgi:hypothetical protein